MPAASFVSQLESGLRSCIAGEVRFDDMSRGLYSTDASIYQIAPVGVVFPKSAADVRATVEVAAVHRVPILPRGSGTSLSGQTVGSALVIDFSRFMNRILDLDVERRLVRVEPGVVLDELNWAVKPHGLQFGPDVATSSRANLGGMIGNNSAGSRSVRQGKTIDHVRELRVTLSDGSEIHCRPMREGDEQESSIAREILRIVADNRTEIIRRYPRILRRVSGYNLDAFVPEIQDQFPVAPVVKQLDREWPDRREFNLARMVVGAEGTLGVVTEAVLHLVPLPKERGVVCLQFETIDAALEATLRILECQPSAVELLDRHIIELSRTNLKYRRSLDFIEGTPDAILIVEFSGGTPVQVADGIELLRVKTSGQRGLQKWLQAADAAQREKIWNCRKASAPLLLSIPGARKPIAFVEDPAVDPTKMAAFARRFRGILDQHGLGGAVYGHASVGCLHLRPMLDTKSAGDLRILKIVSDEVAELVREFGGAMSGEHGDGLARSYHNLKLFGPKLFAAFGEVKRAFDPLGLMNPGKVTATPSPIENLRYGTAYHGTPVKSFLDFSREAAMAGMTDEPHKAAGEPEGVSPRTAPDATSGGLRPPARHVHESQGFLAAAEMCNGSGVCRKSLTGTMCPSFMVTHDEEHSTRGRANALRLALSGQLPEGSLTSQRLHDVMDLCLMCKGCKAECPSNVDVAKLKVEFLAHYHQQHRPSLGSVLMANVAWLNRIGSALAPVSNWLAASMPAPEVTRSVSEGERRTGPRSRFGLLSAVFERLTGVDRRRSLPRFAPRGRSFGAWFRRHAVHPNAGRVGRVVLMDDCLTSYCEPHIPIASVELLERAGYTVELAGLWCCGRPFISKGFVEQGRSLARENVARLVQFVEQGMPILGHEPSCLLTLVDEYPDLVPSDATRKVKENSFLLGGWIADRIEAGDVHLAFSLRNETALVHGHCQQKALVGTGAMNRALRMIPGLTVREVDSGCCGMAGSFGYDHFDISQQIGERVLFPEVRAHRNDLVIAPGFSCRHQIADGTGVEAVHPVVLLRQQVADCSPD